MAQGRRSQNRGRSSTTPIPHLESSIDPSPPVIEPSIDLQSIKTMIDEQVATYSHKLDALLEECRKISTSRHDKPLSDDPPRMHSDDVDLVHSHLLRR